MKRPAEVSETKDSKRASLSINDILDAGNAKAVPGVSHQPKPSLNSPRFARGFVDITPAPPTPPTAGIRPLTQQYSWSETSTRPHLPTFGVPSTLSLGNGLNWVTRGYGAAGRPMAVSGSPVAGRLLPSSRHGNEASYATFASSPSSDSNSQAARPVVVHDGADPAPSSGTAAAGVPGGWAHHSEPRIPYDTIKSRAEATTSSMGSAPGSAATGPLCEREQYTIRPRGYWSDFANVEREVIAFLHRNAHHIEPGRMPTQKELRAGGASGSLKDAFRLHGGTAAVAKRLGLRSGAKEGLPARQQRLYLHREHDDMIPNDSWDPHMQLHGPRPQMMHSQMAHQQETMHASMNAEFIPRPRTAMGNNYWQRSG